MPKLLVALCLALVVGGYFAVVSFSRTDLSISAEQCRNAGALGTSRVMAIDPKKRHKVGTLQYSDTLPLGDHELVLTFDDGPIPPSTTAVLDALAAECVKATFFILGENAQDSPALVRRAQMDGHTIGTHTQTHPHLSKLSLPAAKTEIDKGIDSTAAALGHRQMPAPFFRAPYLDMTGPLDGYLVSRGLMLWGIDFQAEDWNDISVDAEIEEALSGIEKKGKGILLLHDIQARTAMALPRLLKELKLRGYHIVHVIPAPVPAMGPVASQQ
jgi:peptidoglycan-N-acetylglucosamine deacetylase